MGTRFINVDTTMLREVTNRLSFEEGHPTLLVILISTGIIGRHIFNSYSYLTINSGTASTTLYHLLMCTTDVA